MFKAIVLICVLTGPQKGVCLEAHDEWGPYQTQAECKARVEKMITDLRTVPSGLIPVGSKCVNQQGEGV